MRFRIIKHHYVLKEWYTIQYKKWYGWITESEYKIDNNHPGHSHDEAIIFKYFGDAYNYIISNYSLEYSTIVKEIKLK